MNFVYGTITSNGAGGSLSFADEEVFLNRAVLSNHPRLTAYAGTQLVVGIRPEAFEISSAVSGADGLATISVGADLVEQLGSEAYIHFTKQAPPVITPDIRELLEDEGSDVSSLGDSTKFVARVNPDFAPRGGERMQLVLDVSKLHFFDSDTGTAIN